MAKVSVLMPHPELRELAISLIAQYPRIEPIAIEYVQTEQIRDKAMVMEKEGCDLIVARGLQARIARDSVRIPIIEMRASTQELASQVLEMKHVLLKAGLPPCIGLIGVFNMFHSTERFNEILGVELHVYMATDREQYAFLVNRARGDGCTGIIGGEQVGKRAWQLGLIYRFLSMGEESIREAFEAASLLGYSIDLHKRNDAEMNAMLDNAAASIIQVNAGGVIQRANRQCFSLLGLEQDEVIDREATSVIPNLPIEEFKRALETGSDIDSAVLTLNQATVLMNVTPVLNGSRVEGAICTFQEGVRISEMDSRLRQETARRGQSAIWTFSDLPTVSESFNRVLNQARRLSRTAACVLLEGESGVGKEYLAQCIHNESSGRGGAFVEVDCAAWHPDDLDGLLFGGYSSRSDVHCLVEQAVDGTLYLKQIEAFSPALQYKLLLLTRDEFLRARRIEVESVRVRLVVSTEESLQALAAEGSFRQDLYFALAAGKLVLPPLRERREEIAFWLKHFLDYCQKRFKRYITLTKEAREWLENQNWPGNLNQIQSLCARMVLLSEKRTVTLDMARRHMKAMETTIAKSERETVYRSPEAIALMSALQANVGDRRKTADEMGISTTTLWRRMKQLGINRDLTWEETQ